MPRKQKKELLDCERLAYNLQAIRSISSLSQAQLAAMSGVSVSTIYHIENGGIVRRSTLEKLAQAMQQTIEQLTMSTHHSNQLTPDLPYLKHLPEDTVWLLNQDFRKHVPEGNQQLIQDPQERMRLGSLGLVPIFGSVLSFVMPDGPGVSLFEVFGRFGPVGMPFKDRLYYVIRGKVKFEVSDDSFVLSEGGAIGCHRGTQVWFDLPTPLKTGELPPLVLQVGSNRVGRYPKKPSAQ